MAPAKRNVVMNVVMKVGFMALVTRIGVGSIDAHHSYSEYDRETAASIEGEVEEILWVNPHVVLRVETQSSGTIRAEWWNLQQFARFSRDVHRDTLKIGDHVIITGSVNKNPETRIITLLREVRRPVDGWIWSNPNNASTNGLETPEQP